MRIGLDATAISATADTGMGTYSRNLTRALLELDTDHELVVYCRGGAPEGFEALNDIWASPMTESMWFITA